MAWGSYGVPGVPLGGCSNVRLAHDPGAVLYGAVIVYTNEQGRGKVSWAAGSQWSTVREGGSGCLLE